MLATGKVEVITGRRAHGRATRRPGARSSPTGSGLPSRTSRSCTVTPRSRHGTRHLRLALARRGWRGRRAWPPTRSSRRPGRSPRTCSRRRSRTSSSSTARSRSRAPTTARRWPRWSGPRSPPTTFPTGVEPDARRRGDLRPGGLLVPARHPPVRRSRSTPRPVRSTLRKYVCVDDIGNIINPLIVEGQMHGGIVQGIAQALWEDAVFDDQGTLVTGSFVDYTLPTRPTRSVRHREHHLAVDDERPRHQGCR